MYNATLILSFTALALLFIHLIVYRFIEIYGLWYSDTLRDILTASGYFQTALQIMVPVQLAVVHTVMNFNLNNNNTHTAGPYTQTSGYVTYQIAQQTVNTIPRNTF